MRAARCIGASARTGRARRAGRRGRTGSSAAHNTGDNLLEGHAAQRETAGVTILRRSGIIRGRLAGLCPVIGTRTLRGAADKGAGPEQPLDERIGEASLLGALRDLDQRRQ